MSRLKTPDTYVLRLLLLLSYITSYVIVYPDMTTQALKFEVSSVSSRKSVDKYQSKNQNQQQILERAEREDLVKRRKEFNRNERFFFVIVCEI